MTADVVKLPASDPIFALAPELKLHQSELDGTLVVNSREVARVFLRDDHGALIRHIMWSIWNDPMQPDYHDEFRQRPDGTVDMTSHGLLSALHHWGFEYEYTERHDEFMSAWSKWVSAKAQEIEAKTGVNPMVKALEKIGLYPHYFTHDGRQCCDDCKLPKPAGPMLYDNLWRSITKSDSEWPWLCFDCTEARLGRPLTQADLKPCPFNAGWISFDGADVAAMQFARGRRLLPEGGGAMTDDERRRNERLLREGEAVIENYLSRQAEMRAQILPMAYGLLTALHCYRTRESFEAWFKNSPYADFSEADIAALIKIGEHCEIAEKFLRTTTLVEPQEIWNALKERIDPEAAR
jgi:hypothetical protein